MICQSARYDESAVVYAGGIARKEALTGGVETVSEQPYLSAVRMPRTDYAGVAVAQVAAIVFGMVTEQQLCTSLCRKLGDIVHRFLRQLRAGSRCKQQLGKRCPAALSVLV